MTFAIIHLSSTFAKWRWYPNQCYASVETGLPKWTQSRGDQPHPARGGPLIKRDGALTLGAGVNIFADHPIEMETPPWNPTKGCIRDSLERRVSSG